MTDSLHIRLLEDHDPEMIAAAFSDIGWNKPTSIFERYLAEQASGTRTCSVAIFDRSFAGYVTVNWRPSYAGFAENKIPEIQDLNVLPLFRRKGIGTALLSEAERCIARRSNVAGISMGLHPGYNDAQRLYIRLGYIPDGKGITYRNEYPREGEKVALDDDLLLHLTKNIRT
jgi:GNAT superfamily N-acetyltransferase